MKLKSFWGFTALAVVLIFASCTSKKKLEYVTIGTGGVTGIYYPSGGAIAKMVNKKRDAYGIRASVESTGGSVYNINAILAGELELGVCQSDRQYQAYNGLSEWKGKPQKDLRAVFSLHRESITVVAAADAGIDSLDGLKGKRVNLGNIGSGHRGNALDILQTLGIDWEKELKAESLQATEANKFLQDNRIDAFFYTVGHPSGAITEVTSGKRKVKFIPVEKMEALLAKFPYYAEAVIPVKEYPMAVSKKDVPTIGVVATIVTSAKVSNDTIYNITKEVFENLEDFKKLHPAFARLTKEGMLKGISAPIHPGALKYYKEIGLVK